MRRLALTVLVPQFKDMLAVIIFFIPFFVNFCNFPPVTVPRGLYRIIKIFRGSISDILAVIVLLGHNGEISCHCPYHAPPSPIVVGIFLRKLLKAVVSLLIVADINKCIAVFGKVLGRKYTLDGNTSAYLDLLFLNGVLNKYLRTAVHTEALLHIFVKFKLSAAVRAHSGNKFHYNSPQYNKIYT